MSGGYAVLNDGTVVITKWEGTVTYDDIVAHETERSNDPSIQPDAVMLVDGRRAVFEASSELAEEFSTIMSRLNVEKPVSKLAMLVPDENYETARIFERHNVAKGLDMIVFSSLSVVCKWLGIDYDQTVQCLSEMELK